MRIKAMLARLERALPPSYHHPAPDADPAQEALVSLYSMLSPDDRDAIREVLTQEPLPADWREQVEGIVGREMASGD